MAQAQFRFDPMHLERVPFFQMLCAGVSGGSQSSNDGKKEVACGYRIKRFQLQIMKNIVELRLTFR